jgi:hypothetical protein
MYKGLIKNLVYPFTLKGFLKGDIIENVVKFSYKSKIDLNNYKDILEKFYKGSDIFFNIAFAQSDLEAVKNGDKALVKYYTFVSNNINKIPIADKSNSFVVFSKNITNEFKKAKEIKGKHYSKENLLLYTRRKKLFVLEGVNKSKIFLKRHHPILEYNYAKIEQYVNDIGISGSARFIKLKKY